MNILVLNCGSSSSSINSLKFLTKRCSQGCGRSHRHEWSDAIEHSVRWG